MTAVKAVMGGTAVIAAKAVMGGTAVIAVKAVMAVKEMITQCQ